MEFSNVAIRDFSKSQNRDWIQTSIQNWRKRLPVKVPVVVGGQIQSCDKSIRTKSPNDLSLTIAEMSMATTTMADLALTKSLNSQADWAARGAGERARILEKVANLIERDRNELVTLMLLEVGKDLRECDADICEAIDFCRFYANEARRLSPKRLTMSIAGESNYYFYQPRGLTVAISPWNFPLAILCGMTAAPLVCGNPVIMKCAEQSSAVAYELYNLFVEAGVPEGVLHFLPGLGEEIGAYLVKDPRVHIISFTGSKAVGLEIIGEAAVCREGQFHVKRVIAEMGGKNGLLIDEDADLDEAVLGAVQSAFGFQGQKCSALSRLIVHKDVYEKFKKRFVDAVASLKVGPSFDLSNRVGPVIDEESRNRLLQVIARNADKIIFQSELSDEVKNLGTFVAPTIFESGDSTSELGQVEFFGPLVTLFKVESFEEGIKKINEVPYALTGGLYSRSPEHIEKAYAMLEVGNLYINRSITGALVCRQPFGGYKLSGVGAKAGGQDYLLQFLEPRTVSENTMRRGFAPELQN